MLFSLSPNNPSTETEPTKIAKRSVLSLSRSKPIPASTSSIDKQL